jgi:hypothetical protein
MLIDNMVMDHHLFHIVDQNLLMYIKIKYFHFHVQDQYS